MNENLKLLGKSFKKEVQLYQLVLKDKRTPTLGKFFLWLAIGYLFLPFDLIPDFIPVIGHIDDIIIIPVLVFIAIKLIPEEIIVDNRRKIKNNY